MQYHLFPGTELSVSRLCFGCWGVISDAHWGDRVAEDSIAAMETAVEAGINFFDTAPVYGNGGSEALLGQFLADRGIRGQTIVATKVPPNKMMPSEVAEACESSLKLLQTDYIDLYQTHWTNPNVPIADTWEAMLQLQQQGKVRYVGVCNAGVQDLTALKARHTPMSNQLPYNLIWRMLETAILPQCVSDNIGVLVYSPLMHGLLADNYRAAEEVPDGRARSRHFSSNRAQTRHGEAGCEELTFATLARIRGIAQELERPMAEIALAWLVQQTGVASVIAGARTSTQVHANLGFLSNPLEETTIERLTAATADLKAALGDNPDLWDGSGNGRFH